MLGYLNTIRLIKQGDKQEEYERLLTTLQLLTAAFIYRQDLVVRLIIIEYFFKNRSWTAAIAAVSNEVGYNKNTDYVTVILDLCSEWDRNHCFL